MQPPTRVIDTFVQHEWTNRDEFTGYLPAAWQEFVGHAGLIAPSRGALPLAPQPQYEDPRGRWTADSLSARTDKHILREELPHTAQTERLVLYCREAMLMAGLPNYHLALALVRAANEWTADRWLDDQDASMHGLVVVPSQLPDEAAREIRRAGANPRFAGVMGANGLGKPFGHAAFHPIYEAAAELGLPIVIWGWGEALADTVVHPTAAGLPSFYGEFRALSPQPAMTHLVSMIGDGVFEKYPALTVLLVGSGFTWVPEVIWRFDADYRALRREAPWLTRSPSEYLRDNVRFCTYPLEDPPSASQLERVLAAVEGLGDLICFGSGYPGRDADDLGEVVSRVPADLRQSVCHDTAEEVFRWTS